MLIKELIGKTITNIYTLYEPEVGGQDKAECFIELDHDIIIDIPFGFSDGIWIKELDKKAASIFVNLKDYPVYHVNKNHKSITEIAENHKRRQKTFFNQFLKSVFGYDIKVKEYQPYKVEYKENNLKHIKDRKIIDFVWYPYDESQKGLLLLDNGVLITETTVAFHGTGLAGLNYFQSLDELTSRRGDDYNKLTMLKPTEQ